MSDLIMVFRNLLALVKAGLPLAPGCRRLSENSSTSLRVTWQQLAEKLESGQPLSAALATVSVPVAPWMIQMIEAGETSGTVDQMLHYLVEELETRIQWKRRMAMRMLYPVVLLHLTALLPAIPLWMNHGGGFALLWTGTLLGIIYLPLLIWWLLHLAGQRSLQAQAGMESLTLNVPLLGPSIRAARAARFYQALSALCQASLRWEDAVSSAAAASDSRLLQIQSEENQSAFLQGNDLTTTLKQFDFFTAQDMDILSTGEITGTLDQTLARLAGQSWETARQKLQILSVALTVGAYFLCIGGVLLAVLSIMGPIYYQLYELLAY